MPPIIFYIGIGGISFLLIAYAVMELARPWPTHSKERAKKKHDEKVAKRHAERDEILEEAIEADKMYQKLTSDENFEQAFESEDPTSTEEEIDETENTETISRPNTDSEPIEVLNDSDISIEDAPVDEELHEEDTLEVSKNDEE